MLHMGGYASSTDTLAGQVSDAIAPCPDVQTPQTDSSRVPAPLLGANNIMSYHTDTLICWSELVGPFEAAREEELAAVSSRCNVIPLCRS